MKKWMFYLGAGALLSLGVGTSLAASPSVVGVRSLERWQGPGQEVASTLNVVEFSCMQQSRRIFVRMPPDVRWTLESVVVPGSGTARLALRHDATGWGVDVMDQLDLAVELPSPAVFGDPLFWQRLGESGPVERERVLRVNGVDRLVSTGEGHLMTMDDLATSFRQDALRETLAPQVPVPVRRDVESLSALLDAADAETGSLARFRPLVDLIRSSWQEAAAESAAGKAAAPWTRIDSRAFAGTGSTELEERSLLRAYTTVEDPADPLAGLHAPPDGGCPEVPGDRQAPGGT